MSEDLGGAKVTDLDTGYKVPGNEKVTPLTVKYGKKEPHTERRQTMTSPALIHKKGTQGESRVRSG